MPTNKESTRDYIIMFACIAIPVAIWSAVVWLDLGDRDEDGYPEEMTK